jgi:hypothetical protein
MTNPNDDQSEARRRDLRRFFQLIQPHLAEGGTDVPAILGRLPPDEHTEAMTIYAGLQHGASTWR